MTDQSLAIIKKTLNSEAIMKRFASLMGEREATYYINSVMLTVANSDTLQKCTPESIVYSALRAASLRLSCDQALGEAWLIPFKNGKTGDSEAVFVPGYKGLRNLATRTNKYRYVNAGRLLNGQQWVEDLLTGKCTITGKAIDNTTVGWFAFFEMFSGYSKGLYMTLEQIHDHAKQYSKTYSNPKSKWQSKDLLEVEAMEKKTVFRLLLVRWGDLGKAGNAFVEDEIIDGDFHDLPIDSDDGEPKPKQSVKQNLNDLGYESIDPIPTKHDSEAPIEQNETTQAELPIEPAARVWTEDEIYTQMVEAKAAPDLYSARGSLAKCSTGWETPAKAEAWLKIYRQWRTQKLSSDDAAAKANNGEIPAN